MLSLEQVRKFSENGLTVEDPMGVNLDGLGLIVSGYPLWNTDDDDTENLVDKEPRFGISRDETTGELIAYIDEMFWEMPDPRETTRCLSLDDAIDYICSRFKIYQGRLARCSDLNLPAYFPEDFNAESAHKILFAFFNSTNVEELQKKLNLFHFSMSASALLEAVQDAINGKQASPLTEIEKGANSEEILDIVKSYLFDGESVPPVEDFSDY